MQPPPAHWYTVRGPEAGAAPPQPSKSCCTKRVDTGNLIKMDLPFAICSKAFSEDCLSKVKAEAGGSECSFKVLRGQGVQGQGRGPRLPFLLLPQGPEHESQSSLRRTGGQWSLNALRLVSSTESRRRTAAKHADRGAASTLTEHLLCAAQLSFMTCSIPRNLHGRPVLPPSSQVQGPARRHTLQCC